MFERETEMLRVEVGGALHIGSLVPNTMQSTNRMRDLPSSFIGERNGSAVCPFHGLLHKSLLRGRDTGVQGHRHGSIPRQLKRRLIDGKAIQQSGAAYALQVLLAASGRGVLRIPRIDAFAEAPSIVMPHLRPACAAGCPVTAREVLAPRIGRSVRAGSGEDVVHVGRVTGAVHLIELFRHGGGFTDLDGVVVKVLDVRRDQQSFGVVPRPGADPIACIHRRSPVSRRYAEIRAPRVVSGAFGARERLTMRVSASESAQITAPSYPLARDE